MDLREQTFEDYVRTLTNNIRNHDEQTIRKIAGSLSNYSKTVRIVLFEHMKNCESCKKIYDDQKSKSSDKYIEGLKEKLESHNKSIITAYAKAGRTFSSDAREVIQNHIDNCEVCKSIYDRTSKSLIESLKLASNSEVQEFGTPRSTSISSRSANNRARKVGRQYIRTK